MKQENIPEKGVENKADFFLDKIVKLIQINPIRVGGKIKIIRLCIRASDDDEDDEKICQLYRIDFSDKKIKLAVKRAIKFAEKISENVSVHPAVKDILGGGKGEIYKYQKKLDLFKTYPIYKIGGHIYFHKSVNNQVYVVLFSSDDNIPRKIMFGGKNMSIQDAYKLASEFIQKLLKFLPEDTYVNLVKP